MMPINRTLVTASMTTAPVSITADRNAIDNPAPEIDWINVVSVVNRDKTSPIFVISKKDASSVTTCR